VTWYENYAPVGGGGSLAWVVGGPDFAWEAGRAEISAIGGCMVTGVAFLAAQLPCVFLVCELNAVPG